MPVSDGQIQINYDTLDNLMGFCMVYHEDEDILFLRPVKPLPGTSVDWNGEIWIRVSMESGEIIGLEIDEFESVFIKRHPELEKAWREIKPLCISHKPLSCTIPSGLIILGFFKSLLTPQRVSLASVS